MDARATNRPTQLSAAPQRLRRKGDQARSRCRLPAPLTTIVGREHELNTGRRILLDPHVRLLTLTGAPGAGKTRLGLALAETMRAKFRDGVWFVALAPLEQPELVLPTLAQVLGIRQVGRRPLSEALALALCDRSLLVVLDNFEHLLSAAPTIVELLAACPLLTVLATSRAPLHVSGEHLLPVEPLELPRLSPLPELEDLARVPAVGLFVQRARAVRPAFELTTGNSKAVAELCIRVDGLPLAIELAAARVTLLEPEELVARLGSRLALLGEGPQDLAPRQRTLRRAIGWSYEILSHDEQRLFRRLGVFAGGCTLDQATFVGDSSDDETLDVLEGMAILSDHNLVRKASSGGSDVRFEMLETIREYALEQLTASGELESARRRHADLFVALGEQVANPRLDEPDGPALLDRLEREHDNLRSALGWLRESHDVEGFMQLAGALWAFWEMRGHWNEGLAWLESALSQGREASTRARARALLGAAVLHRCRNEFTAALALAQKSIECMRRLGDPGLGAALLISGQMRATIGDYSGGAALCAESVAVRRRQGAPVGLAWSLLISAQVRMMTADYATARLQCEAARRLRRGQAGGAELDCHLLWSLAVCSIGLGDSDAVRPLLEESLALSRSRGQLRMIAWFLLTLGDLLVRTTDAAGGRRLLQESRALFRELGESLGVVITTLLLDEPVAGPILEEFGEQALSSIWRMALGRDAPREAFEQASGIRQQMESASLTADSIPVGARLTPRELEVLALLGRRYSNREIADTLVLSVRTVERHVANIYEKTRVSSRRQAAAGALEMGLLPPN